MEERREKKAPERKDQPDISSSLSSSLPPPPSALLLPSSSLLLPPSPPPPFPPLVLGAVFKSGFALSSKQTNKTSTKHRQTSSAHDDEVTYPFVRFLKATSESLVVIR